MSNADAVHFDSYRDQTRTKHRILEGYLPAYYNVLKKHHQALVYIDGFAGRGFYTQDDRVIDGSPLIAMKLFASDPDFQRKVQCFFIESRDDHFGTLKQAIDAQQLATPLAKPPRVLKATFQTFAAALADRLQGGRHPLPPTFLFVDPCGVDGVRMRDLTLVLSREYGELFIFFNYEGVNRITGLAESSGGSPTLVELLGTPQRVAELISVLGGVEQPQQREQMIVAAFRRALSADSGATFTLPFRIEAENRRATSHYLLYATKHPLGFKIMKEVMWRAGNGSDATGGLELLQASEQQAGLFQRADLACMETAITDRLASGPARVSEFTHDWVARPTDLFSTTAYKQCLLRLEQEDKVEILDKGGSTAVPASSRRKHRGAATLGDDYVVRLKSA